MKNTEYSTAKFLSKEVQSFNNFYLFSLGPENVIQYIIRVYSLNYLKISKVTNQYFVLLAFELCP